MNSDINAYNSRQSEIEKPICDLLQKEISAELQEAESKIWYAHPVWFIDGNPVVGYSKLKSGIRLLFWSGVDFEEDGLKRGSGKFMDASKTYKTIDEVVVDDVRRWLKKCRTIQWDYKNLIKRKGKLIKLNVS